MAFITNKNGGGIASDYNGLDNQPSINGFLLRGNKTSEQLGIPTVKVNDVNQQNFNFIGDDTTISTLSINGVERKILGLYENCIKPSHTAFFEPSKNKINYADTISGEFVNQTTGGFDVSASHRRTKFIKCGKLSTYTFSYRNKSTMSDISQNVAFRYALYDSGFRFIRGGLNETTFLTTDNTEYLAISWLQSNDSVNLIQLEFGESYSEFQEYALKLPENLIFLPNYEKDLSILKNYRNATNVIFDDDFSNGIKPYLKNNGFNHIGSSLVSSSIGYDKQIYFNKDVCLDKEKITVNVSLNDVNSIIGVGFRSAIAGLLAEIDFKNRKLIIRNVWGNPDSITPPTVFLETSITFLPVVGRRYNIVVEKDTRKNCSIQLTDCLTFETVKLDCITKNTTSPSNAWGGACIVSIEGSFNVNRFTFNSVQPPRPKLAIYGDSFIEGTTLMPNIEKRYAQLVKDKLNGDCIVGGKGGENTGMFLGKLETYSKFSPQYTIIALGLNDTVFSAYKTNIIKMANWCKSIGSVPILTTITRNASNDNLAFMKQVNDFVRSSGYSYIDFAKVMSVGFDGETHNPELFLADGVHPNANGHLQMFKKVLEDAYYIFE